MKEMSATTSRFMASKAPHVGWRQPTFFGFDCHVILRTVGEGAKALRHGLVRPGAALWERGLPAVLCVLHGRDVIIS